MNKRWGEVITGICWRPLGWNAHDHSTLCEGTEWETKHSNRIPRLSRRKLGIARGDTAAVFRTTQSTLENPWVRVWGKIQELGFCQSHSALWTARAVNLIVWGRYHPAPTLIQSQNRIPESSRWENSSKTFESNLWPITPCHPEESTKNHVQSLRTCCTSHSFISFPRIWN